MPGIHYTEKKFQVNKPLAAVICTAFSRLLIIQYFSSMLNAYIIIFIKISASQKHSEIPHTVETIQPYPKIQYLV